MSLLRPTPTEQVNRSSSLTRRRMSPSDGGTIPELPPCPRHVEEGLVERDALDHGRHRLQDGVQLLAHLGVAVVVTLDEDGRRASAPCLGGRHGRVHPEPARLVGAGGHYAPAATAADDDRLAGQATGRRGPRPRRRRRPCPRGGSRDGRSNAGRRCRAPTRARVSDDRSRRRISHRAAPVGTPRRTAPRTVARHPRPRGARRPTPIRPPRGTGCDGRPRPLP